MFGRERGERIWRFAGGDRRFRARSRRAARARLRRAARDRGSRASIREKAAARARQRVDDWTKRGAPRRIPRPRAGRGHCRHRHLPRRIRRPPRAAALQPLSYARELARVALAAGARVHAGARVVELDAEGSRLARGHRRRSDGARRHRARRDQRLRRRDRAGSRAIDRRVELAADRDGADSCRRCADAAAERRDAVRYAPGDPLLAARRRGPAADGRPRPVSRIAMRSARLEPSRARRAHAISRRSPTSRSRIAGADAWRCTSTTCRGCIGRNRSF